MADLTGLERKLRRVGPAIEEAARTAMAKYADELVAQMKLAVPVDSGALRNSIGWTFGDPPEGSTAIGTVNGARTGVFITIYAGTRDKSLGDADAFYARWQEFGTRKMPANPFFYPVWRSNRKRVRAGITRAVRRAVRNAN